MGDRLRSKPLLAAAAIAMATVSAADTPRYPADFRGWAHVKSALITERHPAFAAEGGLHHIYANSKAAAGYTTGRFEDGSIIVYELLETSEKNGVVTEGPRRRIDVMRKEGVDHQDTGGWKFERFRGANPDEVGTAAKTLCFDCHARAAGHGFVFSQIR